MRSGITSADVLGPRWRRLDAAVAEVRSANVDSDTEFPDSTVRALDAINHLWELWAVRRGWRRKWALQNEAAAPQPEGRTTAALIFVRGDITHADPVEPSHRLGLGTQPFGTSPFGRGGWYWRPRSDDRPNYKDRSDWYAELVDGHEVLGPLERACLWLAAQPQIARPPKIGEATSPPV